jgi:hypothetical protein
MRRLPAGYHIIGGLSIAYALVMGGCVVLWIGLAFNEYGPLSETVLWMLAGTFMLAPLPLLLGGVLLLSSKAAMLRTASWTLGIAGVLLLLKSYAVRLAVVELLRNPKLRDPLAAAVDYGSVLFVIVPAAIWGSVVLVTGYLLQRRLRRDLQAEVPRKGSEGEKGTQVD